MNKDEVRELIYSGLRAILPNPPYRLSKPEGAFVRKITEGAQKLFVPLMDYKPEYRFSLAIGIRLDAVEDVFNRASGADDKGRKITLTSITQLSYFTNDGRREYSVSTPSDVETALTDLGSIIRKRIFPFLEQFNNVHALDAAMNGEQESTFDSTMFLYHAMHSIVLARLAKNGRYTELVNSFSEKLSNAPTPDKARFSQLVAILAEPVH